MVTYTLTVTNTAVETMKLTSLSDDQFGDLDGRGDCQANQDIPQGGWYACAYTGFIFGSAGGIFTNTVTAVAWDNDGNTITETVTATVDILAPGALDFLDLDPMGWEINPPVSGLWRTHPAHVEAALLFAWRRTCNLPDV